ncbi:MAG: S8/S53 family peptidase [Candidatus Eremiobacteraeota bacterium]|nr:S8/S53 family peptidase [Candidatus Eremiobacteraeota bacterium]
MYAAYPQAAPQGVRIYVHLPLRNSSELDQLISQQSDKKSPLYHHWLTPAQFRASYGPAGADLRSVATALNAQGFHTTVTSQGVVADAPQATVEKAFGVHLAQRTASLSRGTATVRLMQADRAPVMPAALKAVNAQVAAFAPLPAMQPQSMLVSKTPIAENRYGVNGPYWFDGLKEAYQYPSYTRLNGTGKTIAILAASDFLDSDVALYFGHEHLTPPAVERRPVDGGSPPFNINNGTSDEVALDVQQAGGSAPGAKIVVYEAPDASIAPSFLDMYTAIVDDNIADVSSASYGLCELDFTAAYNGGQDFTYLFQTFHDVFRQGNAQGITFVNSSGDEGALGCTDASGTTAVYGVIWPANDPDNTAVGGTNLQTSYVPGSKTSTYISENAYHDTFDPAVGYPAGWIWGSGGGVSKFWSKPLYQNFVNTHSNMRTVPDVAMHMGGCPYGALTPCGANRSADVTALNGGLYLLIGTSASAPEFAGLQAIQDQALGGRAGNANYLIYFLSAFNTVGNGPVFHQNIPGNNGYPTHPGYNYVLGNGTPYAAQYVFDPFGPFAGDPQTPTNP